MDGPDLSYRRVSQANALLVLVNMADGVAHTATPPGEVLLSTHRGAAGLVVAGTLALGANEAPIIRLNQPEVT